jgi:lipopolysaccharide heptosyltransferase I
MNPPERKMADERFLIVRLGSLGDIVFTLPMLAALRDTFCRSHIAWVVNERWKPLLEGNPDLNDVITLPSSSISAFFACGKRLRDDGYTTVFDVQGLYKSALLARLTHVPQRIGYSFSFAREGAAAFFYTQRVKPTSKHIVDQNVELAAAAGAKIGPARFPLSISSEAQSAVNQFLTAAKISRYVVLSPGGGWLSKLWPPDRFGELALKLWERHGLRIIVNCGPGEAQLAEIVVANAALALPIIVQYGIPEMMELLRGAELVVAADSGPLHLANALGTPVVGLFGQTSPDRNGPYGGRDIVVRNVDDSETTYKREKFYSEEMCSISVDQVMEAVEKRLAQRALEGDEHSSGESSANRPEHATSPEPGSIGSDAFGKPAGSAR